jgi:lycopene beta-cyclase
MFNIPSQGSHSQNVIKGGIAAGAMRASTGYCFANIQKWATNSARQIVTQQKGGSKSFVSHDVIGFTYRLMDDVMLNVLKKENQLGPTLFVKLAKHLSGASFARFMSQEAMLKDLFQVIYAFPKKPFIFALGTTIKQRLMVQ